MRERFKVVVLLILSGLSGSIHSATDESVVDVIRQGLEPVLCNPTLYACSDSTPESCNAIVTNAFAQCPSAELVDSTAAELDGSGTVDAAVEAAKEYGMCVSRRFQILAAEENIPEDCLFQSVSSSIDEVKNEAKARLENGD